MTHVSRPGLGDIQAVSLVSAKVRKTASALRGGCLQKDLEATAVSLKSMGCLHVFSIRELAFDYLPWLWLVITIVLMYLRSFELLFSLFGWFDFTCRDVQPFCFSNSDITW